MQQVAARAVLHALWLAGRAGSVEKQGGIARRGVHGCDLRRGLTNSQIAKALGISEHTVKHHVKAVCGKLDTSDRTEAVARAFELGLLQ